METDGGIQRGGEGGAAWTKQTWRRRNRSSQTGGCIALRAQAGFDAEKSEDVENAVTLSLRGLELAL